MPPIEQCASAVRRIAPTLGFAAAPSIAGIGAATEYGFPPKSRKRVFAGESTAGRLTETLISAPPNIIMIIMVISEATMITETSAVAFRQNLGEMINQVQYRHDSVVINKDGKPVAALVDARLFERIRRMQSRFDALCQRIEAGFASMPEADGMAEIDAAIKAERTKAIRAAKKKR